jgi:hypothetical protein
MSEKKEIKVIKNIGFLSILSNKENDMLKSADMMKNIGCLVVREDFHSKYPNISLKNIGSTIILPDDAKASFSVGFLNINQGYLDALNSSIHLIALGAVAVAPNTDPALFSKKIDEINLVGAIICPESLSGAVNSVLKGQVGGAISYPDEIHVDFKAENGNNIGITKEYVESLNENTILFINGSAQITENIDETILSKKVYKLIVNGLLTISQDNEKALVSKLFLNGESTVVPSGYEYVKENLNISENNIYVFKGRHIYSEKAVHFSKYLASDVLQENSFKLICKEVICKKTLEKSVSTLLGNPNTKIVSYDNEIIVNNGSRKITSKELSYLKGSVHLLNYGNADFEEGISDELIAEKISGIHNYGMIKCSEESYGLIQSKIIEDQGEIKVYEEKEPENKIIEIALLENMGKAEI